jgi:hypothetical protein
VTAILNDESQVDEDEEIKRVLVVDKGLIIQSNIYNDLIDDDKIVLGIENNNKFDKQRYGATYIGVFNMLGYDMKSSRRVRELSTSITKVLKDNQAFASMNPTKSTTTTTLQKKPSKYAKKIKKESVHISN